MAERIHYDDDPADTAAFQWLCTKVGIRTVQEARTKPEVALRRAYRAGYLIGVKAAEAEERT